MENGRTKNRLEAVFGLKCYDYINLVKLTIAKVFLGIGILLMLPVYFAFFDAITGGWLAMFSRADYDLYALIVGIIAFILIRTTPALGNEVSLARANKYIVRYFLIWAVPFLVYALVLFYLLWWPKGGSI